MAPTIRNVQTGFSASNSANTVVNKPTGLATGDLMIAYHGGEADTTGLTVPSGWTSQRFIAGGGSSNYPAGRLLTKVATASDVSASTFTFVDVGGNGDGVVILAAITAGTYDTTTPLTYSDTTWFSQARVASNVQNTRAITSVNDSLALFLMGTDTNGVTQSYPSSGSIPSGTTFRATRQSATLYSLIGMYSQVLSGTGTLAAKTVTPTGAAGQNGWLALTIIVRPGGVAPPTGANAGADATVTVGDTFSRTGTASGTVTSHSWTVVSAPADAAEPAGLTLATTAALSMRFSTSGTYTLRYTATNSGGSSSDDLILTNNGGSTGSRFVLVMLERANPTAGALAVRNRLINTLGHRVVYIADSAEVDWGGAHDAVFIYAGDADTSPFVQDGYGQSTRPVFAGESSSWDSQNLGYNDQFLNPEAVTALNLRFTTQQLAATIAGVDATDETGTAFHTSSGIAHKFVTSVYFQNAPAADRNNGITIARREANPYYSSIVTYEKGVLDQAGVTIKGRRVCWHLSETQANGGLNTFGLSTFDALIGWMLATPGVGICLGADATGVTGSAFTDTATEVANGLTITARQWKVQAGPANVGNILSTNASVSYTPTVAGNYILRYTVTVTGGTTYYADIKLNAVVPATPTSVSYRYYRFTPTARRDAAATIVQLAEIRFFNGWSEVTTTPTVTNPGGTNPAGEEASFAGNKLVFDKWTNTGTLTAPLVYDFGAPITTTHYIWHTGWDVSERDPVSWTMEGSANGTTWTLIDTETNWPVHANRMAPVGPFVMGSTLVTKTASDTFTLGYEEETSFSRNAIDSVAFTDTTALSILRAVTDSLAFTDLISARSNSTAISDTFTVGDVAVLDQTLLRSGIDNFTLFDIAALLTSESRVASDSFEFTDLAALVATEIRTASDTFASTDLVTALAITASLSDSFSTTDTAVLLRTSALSDAFASTDTSAIAVALSSTETTPFSDVSVLSRLSALTDTFSTTESLAIAINAALSDNASMTDIATLARASAVSDSFSATEALTVAANLALSDNTLFTDTTTLDRVSALTDTFSFTESVATALASAVTDSFTFTEAYALYLATALTDYYASTDTSNLVQALTASDVFNFTDVSSLEIQTNEFTASDAFALTDTASLARASSVSDAFDSVDATTILSALLVGSESFATLDTAAISALLIGTDAAFLTDTAQAARASSLVDSFASTDTVKTLARASVRTDTFAFTDVTALAIARAVSDAFLFTEAISAAITSALSDAYVFTDIYTLFQGQDPSTSDYYQSTDDARVAVALSTSDVFAFTDLSTLVANQTLSRSDTFDLVETATITVVFTRSDAFTPTDISTGSANLTANDTAFGTDDALVAVETSATDEFELTDSSLLFVEIIRTDDTELTETTGYESVLASDDTVELVDDIVSVEVWLNDLDTFDPLTEQIAFDNYLFVTRFDSFGFTDTGSLFIQQGAPWPIDFSDPSVTKDDIDVDSATVLTNCGNPGSATPTPNVTVGATVSRNGIVFNTATVTEQIDIEANQ